MTPPSNSADPLAAALGAVMAPPTTEATPQDSSDGWSLVEDEPTPQETQQVAPHTRTGNILDAIDALIDPDNTSQTEVAPSGAVGEVAPAAGDDKDVDERYPDLPDSATPEARAAWGALKKELKQAKRQLTSAASPPPELEALQSKVSDYEQLQAKLAEKEQILRVKEIEATDEFKAIVTEPLRAIGTAAKSLADKYELSADDLYDALSEDDTAAREARLDELSDGMSKKDAAILFRMAEDTREVLQKETQLRDQAAAAASEIAAAATQKAEQMRAAEVKSFVTNVDSLFANFVERIPIVGVAEGEDPARVIADIKSAVLKVDPTNISQDLKAYALVAGVTLPRLIEQTRKLIQERDALAMRVAAFSSASPSKQRTATTPARQETPGNFIDKVFSELSI